MADQLGDWEGLWQIGWPRERLPELMDDVRFRAYLNLARLRNALCFVQGLIVHVPEGLSPPARRRHSLNAFFLMNSLLVEAEHAINGAAPHFKTGPYYGVLAEAIHDPTFREVTSRCRPARKWSVFHFEQDGVASVSKQGYFANPPAFVRLMSGSGQLDFDIYFDLADFVPFELIAREMDRADLQASFGAWTAGPQESRRI